MTQALTQPQDVTPTTRECAAAIEWSYNPSRQMIEKKPGADWKDMQVRVATILTECGLRTTIGKTIKTARGKVEIDVYATDPATVPPSVYLCECKRWSTPVPQGEVQAFRTTVADSGAHHGLFISAKGLQRGAYGVAKHTNIHLCNWREFQDIFLERWCEEYWIPTFRNGADRLRSYVDPPGSDATLRHVHGEPLEPEEAIGLMAEDMWDEPFSTHLSRMMQEPVPPLCPAIWKLRDSYKRFLPPKIQRTECLRDLLDLLLEFTGEWARRTGRA